MEDHKQEKPFCHASKQPCDSAPSCPISQAAKEAQEKGEEFDVDGAAAMLAKKIKGLLGKIKGK